LKSLEKVYGEVVDPTNEHLYGTPASA